MTTNALYGPVSDRPAPASRDTRNPLNVSETLTGDVLATVSAERPPADLRELAVYTAVPLTECLNGCHSGTGPERAPVLTIPGHYLCSEGKHSCTRKLDRWLRDIPELFGWLLWVKDRGTVAGNPENAKTKQPDAPAPMRLEVVDLLDTRPGFGALAILHGWAEAIRDERKLPRRCDCGHARPGHGGTNGTRKGRCTTVGCPCGLFRETAPTVSAEAGLLVGHLAWCTQQDWAGDLYAEIKDLARVLSDTVGEYRERPVGKCAAWVDRPGVPLPVLCGGALVMDHDKGGVTCLGCGKDYQADAELRELGLIVGAMFGQTGTQLEESA